MHDQIVSQLRTLAPVIAGIVLNWLRLKLGWSFDTATEAALGVVIAGVLMQVYYMVARWLESKFPWMGLLLIVPKQPVYHVNGQRREV
jgi:glutathionyl-hydroquinone reductase